MERRLRELLGAVSHPPESPIPAGIADGALRDFERRTGLVLSPEHEALLQLSNGPCVGPGGIFGIGTARESLDIEKIYATNPRWLELRWIPVAGDGCGNYYLAVPCVDTMADPEAASYVVASDVLRFAEVLLDKEMGAVGWPFDAAVVLREDPGLARFEGRLPLPWSE